MRKVIALVAVGVGGVLTASPESGVEAALLRPCPGEHVVAVDGQPIGCDVAGGQTLTIVGLSVQECLDAGGVPVVVLPVCVGVDF